MVASGSSFNSPCASLGRGLTGDAITGHPEHGYGVVVANWVGPGPPFSP